MKLCWILLHDGFPSFKNCPQGYHFCQTLHDDDKLMSLSFYLKKCFRKHQILEHLHKTSSFILSTLKHLKIFISRCSTLVFHFKLILLYQLNLTTLYNRSNCFPIIQKVDCFYSTYFALRLFFLRSNAYDAVSSYNKFL